MVFGLDKGDKRDKRASTSSTSSSTVGLKSPRDRILKLASSPSSFVGVKACCLVVCNSYYGTKYDLGDAAINDGLLAYQRFAEFGYETKIIYDAKKADFLKVLKFYLDQPLEKLVVYYTGHGTYRYDASGDENDSRDECLVFKDGNVPDDDMHTLIAQTLCQKLLFFADCCHSGSIFDITEAEYKKGFATISACADKEQAAQYWFDKKGQGCLTYYFWKMLDSGDLTQGDLTKLNKKLQIFGQHAEMHGEWMEFFN